jgi:hypothetical protein
LVEAADRAVDSAPLAASSKETLHQACAQAKGGINLFSPPHKGPQVAQIGHSEPRENW